MKTNLNIKFYKILIINLLNIIFIVASCTPAPSQTKSKEAQKTLAEHLVNSVLWYRKSAEMRALYYQCYETAKLKLKNNSDKAAPGTTTAVVLDIDETVLDNSPYEVMLIETGTTYTSESWKAWTEKASCELLPGAAEFLHYADSLGVEIFYISNRKLDELQGTLKNLQKYNLPYANESHVFLRADTSDKTARRKKAAENRDILLFIGDNLTDFSQDFADREKDLGFDEAEKSRKVLHERFVMLPNPMYGEWEKAIYDNTYNLTDEEKVIKKREVLKK